MIRRGVDLAVGLLGLVMTSPVVAAAALAVKLDSPGPAFYNGPRVGRGERQFQIHKLRTMRAGVAGPAVTAGDDVRVTRVGRLLRRTKIDELPQLLNVVKGDMSL
ncbi:MAG: sugar transferase, partial [Chloroflexi bacterium]